MFQSNYGPICHHFCGTRASIMLKIASRQNVQNFQKKIGGKNETIFFCLKSLKTPSNAKISPKDFFLQMAGHLGFFRPTKSYSSSLSQYKWSLKISEKSDKNCGLYISHKEKGGFRRRRNRYESIVFPRLSSWDTTRTAKALRPWRHFCD